MSTSIVTHYMRRITLTLYFLTRGEFVFFKLYMMCVSGEVRTDSYQQSQYLRRMSIIWPKKHLELIMPLEGMKSLSQVQRDTLVQRARAGAESQPEGPMPPPWKWNGHMDASVASLSQIPQQRHFLRINEAQKKITPQPLTLTSYQSSRIAWPSACSCYIKVKMHF